MVTRQAAWQPQGLQRQEVVHAVPPTALKTTRSEHWNVTQTRSWETGQRKARQWRTERTSKPEVEPWWNEASAKTREKGLPVLRVALCERANSSSREKRKKTSWFMLKKKSRRNALHTGGARLIKDKLQQMWPDPTPSHDSLWKAFTDTHNLF